MKCVLVGYSASQRIVPASSFLAHKYLPDFDISFLNHEGEKDSWSGFAANYLADMDDELVIFALDDYLLNSPLNQKAYESALEEFRDRTVVCVKLCPNTPEEHEEYPVTTQYTIWKREYLIYLLNSTTNPWDFEIRGSRILRDSGKKSIHSPALNYPTHSCLSERWPGIRWDGVKEEDIKYLKENGYI